MKKITCVGCGNMGKALASSFLEAGYEIKIVDINEASATDLITKGATYHSELKDALESDLIFLNLPNSKITNMVLSSCEKVGLNGLDIISSTTATPNEVLETEELVTKMGGNFLDCKIECFPQVIGTDSSSLIFSGPNDVFARNEEALKAIMPKPRYVGETVVASAIIDLGMALALHYSSFFCLMEGSALALKYNFDINEFMDIASELQGEIMAGTIRHIRDGFANFNHEYEDSSEASISVEAAALRTVIKSFKDKGINTKYSDTMMYMMDKAIEDGNENKDMTVLMAQVYGTK